MFKEDKEQRMIHVNDLTLHRREVANPYLDGETEAKSDMLVWLRVVGLREAPGAWCAWEKCGPNMFLTSACNSSQWGSVKYSHLPHSQHKAHSRPS